jgi:hypothetical protein
MPNFSVFLRKAGVLLRWLQAQEKSPESACRDALGAGHARTRYTGYFVQVIASCFYARYFYDCSSSDYASFFDFRRLSRRCGACMVGVWTFFFKTHLDDWGLWQALHQIQSLVHGINFEPAVVPF